MSVYYQSFLFFILTVISGCTQVAPLDRQEGPEAPGEWMYKQRMNPDGSMNTGAIARAIRQARETAGSARSLSLEWQLVGPENTGGRITDIALHPQNQQIMYAASSAGGVWKSVDGGSEWTPVFEQVGRMSIGDIAVAPGNPDVVYIGTGEANGSATSGAFFGDGVYKSVDAGATWEHVGLQESHHIGRIVIDPSNSDRVFVASTGFLYGKNEQRGIFRSEDGGETWQKVLFVSDSTSAIDLVIDPQDPMTLFAAMWERTRKPHVRNYAGVTSGIYRTKDGGENWQLMQNGLPPPDEFTGRIGLTIAPSAPNVVYASYTVDPITNHFDGIYRSFDGGQSWVRVDDQSSLNNVFASFGWFFGNIRVHPGNSDSVYVLGLVSFVSGDAGMTWQKYTANHVHVDHHALEIHPQNQDLQVLGTDGGVYITRNAGASWSHVKTIPNTQFYTSETDDQSGSLRYYGGTQDNGTIRTLTGGVSDWQRILGGDGFQVIVDPQDNQIIYAESQWGNLAKSIDGGSSFTSATVGIDNSDRTNWNTPFVLDPSDPSTIYYGSHRLYRSTDRAETWEPISDDLTNPDPSFLGGAESGSISTIAVAPSDSSIIYVGTDDAYVQVSFDRGNTWTIISQELPDRYVTQIVVDPFDALTVYVTFSGYRWLSYLPHVFRSTNAGQTWEDISGNLPEAPVNDLIIDPDIDQALYVATDLGVWTSTDGGVTWAPAGDGLPMTVVNDISLDVNSRKLVAATFGRSMYVLDLLETTSTSAQNLMLSEPLIFPNPVTSTSVIEFTLSDPAHVHLRIRDLRGEAIVAIPERSLPAGLNHMEIPVFEGPAGAYILEIITDRMVTSRCIIKL